MPLSSGPVFDNRRTPTGRQQFALAASDRLAPCDAARSLARAAAALLAPVAGELAEEWADGLRARDLRGPRGAGPAAPTRCRARRSCASPSSTVPIIHRADAIALSREDVVAGAPPIRDWTRPGQQVLVTHGKRGSPGPRRAPQMAWTAASCRRCRSARPSTRPVRATRSSPRWLAARDARRRRLAAAGHGIRDVAASAVMSAGLASMPTAPTVCQRRCSGCAIQRPPPATWRAQARQAPFQVALDREHRLAPRPRAASDRCRLVTRVKRAGDVAARRARGSARRAATRRPRPGRRGARSPSHAAIASSRLPEPRQAAARARHCQLPMHDCRSPDARTTHASRSQGALHHVERLVVPSPPARSARASPNRSPGWKRCQARPSTARLRPSSPKGHDVLPVVLDDVASSSGSP